MKNVVYSDVFDVKLIPDGCNHIGKLTKNLWLRNNIFYVRKMVKGKRILKSLHTGDIFIALLNMEKYKENFMDKDLAENQYMASYEKDPGYQLAKDLYRIQNPTKLVLCSRIVNFAKENGIKIGCLDFTTADAHQNKHTTEQHKLKDIWTNQIKNTNKKANQEIEIIFDCLSPIETIEEIDENPDILLELMDKLYNKLSKKEDQKYFSGKTIKNYLQPFRQILRKADNMKLFKNYTWIKSVLQIDSNKVKGSSIEVLPFDDKDLNILFTAFAKIHKHDFGFIEEAINNEKYKSLKPSLKRIIKYPEAMLYAPLIAFFTGSRANASITLLHKDIDIKKQTISIVYDDFEDEEGQKANGHKKLKKSIRTVSISPVLIKMGFLEYIKKHREAHSPSSMIFYEMLKTKKDYRPTYISEAFNSLLTILNIKPSKGTNTAKHYHSIKKSFYTYNIEHISKYLLKKIAGNKNNSTDVVEKHYIMPTEDQINTAIQKLTYPHIENLYQYLDNNT